MTERKTHSFTVVGSSGLPEVYTLFDSITIDDIMLNEAKAVAAERKTGLTTIFQPASERVRDYLIRTRILTGS